MTGKRGTSSPVYPDNDLIDLLINEYPEKFIAFISSFLQQQGYFRSLKIEARKQFQERIIKLIDFIYLKTSDCTNEICRRILASSFGFLELFDVYNEKLDAAFLKISTKELELNTHLLFKLADFTDKKPSEKYAKLLIEIWKSNSAQNLISQPYISIVKIWDFIITKVDEIDSDKDIRNICEAYLKQGDYRLEEYFTRLGNKLTK